MSGPVRSCHECNGRGSWHVHQLAPNVSEECSAACPQVEKVTCHACHGRPAEDALFELERERLDLARWDDEMRREEERHGSYR